MTIGVLTLELFIGQSNSLKAKRMVLHSLKARLRNHFNVAVAQVDDEDKWQKATIVVVGVAGKRPVVNSLLSSVVTFVEQVDAVQLIDYELELL
ncbi:MAG: DUF503 domain-containing protein [Candidatus Omnitrophica bacterium]|nr:DUF503 domain-containing protein [Candidatus Omnitrophota bacterium]